MVLRLTCSISLTSEPQCWCYRQHVFGIIPPLHTRSLQSLPASTPPSLNHNSHNTRTGHSNRCVFVGITHAEKEAMSVSVNVVSVMKLFSLIPPTRKHTYTHCGLRCCHRFSCSIVMSTERFRSAAIPWLPSIHSSWSLCPPGTEVGLQHPPLILSFWTFLQIQCVDCVCFQISFGVKDGNESRDVHRPSGTPPPEHH